MQAIATQRVAAPVAAAQRAPTAGSARQPRRAMSVRSKPSPSPRRPRSSSAERDDVRNIAIIAHVDHGKTTLVDAMLAQSKVFRENEKVETRVMDSNDLERERGITILSKNTAVTYKDTKINIIDTPGHADFGGEVERVLNMVDGVLLLVDAIEGPMPQTRFVLKKARPGQEGGGRRQQDRPRGSAPGLGRRHHVRSLLLPRRHRRAVRVPRHLRLRFPGHRRRRTRRMADNLEPLFDMVINEVPKPVVDQNAPLQMLVTNLDYDEFKGRIALGRVNAGTIKTAQQIKIGVPASPPKRQGERGVHLQQLQRTDVESVGAGDICAIAGLPDVGIGETIMADGAEPLPTIEVEEPTVRMTFNANTSLCGREGKFVTSRNIKERLDRELERNLALRVEPGDTADTFVVRPRRPAHHHPHREHAPRGVRVLHRSPAGDHQDGPGQRQDPRALRGGRRGGGRGVQRRRRRAPLQQEGRDARPCDQRQGNHHHQVQGAHPRPPRRPQRDSHRHPRHRVLNTIFDGYYLYAGDITMRENGSLVAFETGQVTSYALFSAQERGVMFVKPGVDVYEGQVVGIHQRQGDLKVNVAKRKAATNVRSNKDATVVLNEPKQLSLDDCVEYIANDELVEVTPESVRILKNAKMDKKAQKQAAMKK